jgi:hypothetical protein
MDFRVKVPLPEVQVKRKCGVNRRSGTFASQHAPDDDALSFDFGFGQFFLVRTIERTWPLFR